MELETAAAICRALAAVDRLRLVALCEGQGARVSDLAQCLGESEPAVSRALKALAECGVLVRERQGQSVRYRLASADGEPGRLARLALQAGRAAEDAHLRRARARLRRLRPLTSGAAGRLGQALRTELELAAGGAARGRVLLAGEVPGEVADWALDAARQLVRLGRAGVERDSIDLCIWGIDEQRRDAAHARITDALRRAQDWVREEGRLALHAPYDALESPGSSPAAHLRALFEQRGWRCERIRPLEAGLQHVLVAHASPAAVSAAQRNPSESIA